jgi:hypothetical protein
MFLSKLDSRCLSLIHLGNHPKPYGMALWTSGAQGHSYRRWARLPKLVSSK